MREKYESLALADLRDIAKLRGIRGTSSMKKADVIDAMLALDEQEKSTQELPEKKERLDTAEKQEQVYSATRASKQTEKQEQTGSATRASKQTEKTNSSVKVKQTDETKKSERVSHAERPRQTDASNRAVRPESAEAVNRVENTNYKERTNHIEKTNYMEKTNRKDNDENPVQNDKPETEEQKTEPLREQKIEQTREQTREQKTEQTREQKTEQKEGFLSELDSGVTANGILEVMPDGYGFIRSANYLPGENDVYVAPSQIRRFNMKTGDIIAGNTRVKSQTEKFSALLFVKTINGYPPEAAVRRCNFEDMTPIFPEERLKLETQGASVAMRIMDLMSPVGKGQRGMIVSPPKAGKTTLLKEVAKSVKKNNPDVHLIILLIDERPEEVTDIREAIEGPNVEVIYSTFDELPDHHKRVAEMVMERAKRLVEHKRDVMILLDSITRLTRAYNLTVPPSGRTLSGGLDPAALHMPKKFFGAARNMREGGSLTILATALVDTGSKMDDVVYEEFKGTGNMEMVLDRKLSEKRVFPAIDIPKSGTRREDLLLTQEEMDAISNIRKAFNGMKADEAVDKVIEMFSRTRSNNEFVMTMKKMKIF